MVSLKKVFGLKGKGAESGLSPLVLSESLCNALVTVSQVFGQTWHQHVGSELLLALRSGVPLSGHSLANILHKLIEEAAITRPGLGRRFLIHPNQIVFRTEDRRYMVLIIQGEGETVRLLWQVSTRKAGTSYISYLVDRATWTPLDWKVSTASIRNPELLAKAGGEVLGFLEEAKLLPEKSAFQRALEAQLVTTSSFRERLPS